MTTTTFCFKSGNETTNLTLDRKLLKAHPDSLLSNLGHQDFNGSTTEPISIDMSGREWSPLMLASIENLYNTTDAKILLPKDGVELKDLLDVLDYLGLLPEADNNDMEPFIEFENGIQPATRLRAKVHLMILKCIKLAAKKIEEHVIKEPFSNVRVLFVHDRHYQYDITHNAKDVYFILGSDRFFRLRENSIFRSGLENELEERLGMTLDWYDGLFIVKSPVNDHSEARTERLCYLVLKLPEPAPKRQRVGNKK